MDRLAELSRRLENLLREGVVASVDHVAGLCTVKSGELTTAPIKWLTERAGNARTWWAPSVGEQVLLLCPGGEPTRAKVLQGIYSTDAPRPAGADTAHVTTYPDGALVSYDPEAHQLTATLPAGGKADLTAPGGVHITGDTTITGKLNVSGDTDLGAKLHVAGDTTVDTTLTASTDVVGGGISLKNHLTTNVTAGTGLSGKPQ